MYCIYCLPASYYCKIINLLMTLKISIGAWTICLHVYRLYMLMKYFLLEIPPPQKNNNTIKKTNKIKKNRIRLKKSIEIDTKKK